MREFTPKRRRAAKIREWVAEALDDFRNPGYASSNIAAAVGGDPLTAFALLAVLVSEKLGVKTWNMQTFHDKVEMAKVSIMYLVDGFDNADWVLDILENTVIATSADKRSADDKNPGGLSVYEVYEGVDRYNAPIPPGVAYKPEPDEPTADDHLGKALELNPSLGFLFMLGLEAFADMSERVQDFVGEAPFCHSVRRAA